MNEPLNPGYPVKFCNDLVEYYGLQGDLQTAAIWQELAIKAIEIRNRRCEQQYEKSINKFI